MLSQINGVFFDPKFFATYLFGVVIIVLYAKDKFNLPTYDRAAMGPFAQLPPQSLTMDRRYRHGRTIYVFSLLCLYTAVCIVGPSTFPDLFKVFKDLAPQYQIGPSSNNAEMWPVAAATFLISTGAASDGSILGKIEYFVRQYAHKTAYIPRTVRDLARYFREIDGFQWLTEPERQEDRDERRKRLVELAGAGAVTELEQKKQEISGELMRWIRANTLFYTLQRLFGKSVETVEGRLDELTDLPANIEVYTSLIGTRRELYANVVDANGNFVPSKAETARFAKDVSLMLAVLLSQGARNQTELDDLIKRLGLSEIHFHPSDSSTFLTSMNGALLIGVLVTSAVWLLGYVVTPPLFDLTGIGTTQDLSQLVNSVDVFPWLVTIINASLSYLITFRVLIYYRDGAMESREWNENLASRFRVIALASSVSSILSVIAMVLFFAIINKLIYVIHGPNDVAYLLLLQFLLSMMLSWFGLAYLRSAPLLPFACTLTGPPPFWRSLGVCLTHYLPFGHALCAGILVAVLSLLESANVRSSILVSVTQSFDQSLNGILTNQPWIKKKLVPQTLPPPSEEAQKKTADDADKTINTLFDNLKLTTLGPIWDIDRLGKQKDGAVLPASLKECTTINASTYTGRSLCLLGTICQKLNEISLSAPPPPSAQPPSCPPTAPPPAAGQTGAPAPAPAAAPAPSNAYMSRPAIPYTLFKDTKTCTPYPRSTLDCDEQAFLGLGSSLFQFYKTLQAFDNLYRSNRSYATTIVPTLAAVILAYAFGVGCLFCRAGWLREGIDEPQGRKLIDEIKAHYGLDGAALEASLAQPLKSIGGLTPLEALRYEEFSIKLFDVIKDDKNRIEEFVDLKERSRSEGESDAEMPGNRVPDSNAP